MLVVVVVLLWWLLAFGGSNVSVVAIDDDVVLVLLEPLVAASHNCVVEHMTRVAASLNRIPVEGMDGWRERSGGCMDGWTDGWVICLQWCC